MRIFNFNLNKLDLMWLTFSCLLKYSHIGMADPDKTPKRAQKHKTLAVVSILMNVWFRERSSLVSLRRTRFDCRDSQHISCFIEGGPIGVTSRWSAFQHRVDSGDSSALLFWWRLSPVGSRMYLFGITDQRNFYLLVYFWAESQVNEIWKSPKKIVLEKYISIYMGLPVYLDVNKA